MAGWAALIGVEHDVTGAIAQHREAAAPQRCQHELAALASGHGPHLGVEDLADEFLLVHVHAATLRAGIAERPGLREPGVIEAARGESLLDARAHGGQ